MSSERASVPVKTTDAVTFDTTDALPLNTFVRPYKGLLVLLYYNGRTDRASLQPLHVSLFDNGRTTVRPYSRYSSRCSTTDAQIVRPYSRYSSRCSTTDAQIVRPYSRYSSRFDGDGRTTVRPYTGLLVTCVRTYSYTSVSLHGEQTTACGRTNHSSQSKEIVGTMMVAAAYNGASPT